MLGHVNLPYLVPTLISSLLLLSILLAFLVAKVVTRKIGSIIRIGGEEDQPDQHSSEDAL